MTPSLPRWTSIGRVGWYSQRECFWARAKGEQLLHEGYGKNYERLVKVKARYDPRNLFGLNANIEPRS